MSDEVRRGTVISFDATLWKAAILLDGADVEATLAVGQWVSADTMVTNTEVAVLIFGETNTDDGVVLGPYGAVGTNETAATSYTPAWTAVVTNPVLGNGTLTGRYVRHGDLVSVWIMLTMGTTTTTGSGQWEFSLPVAMGSTVRFVAGTVQAIDSGVADYIGIARLDQSSGKLRGIMSSGLTAEATVPHTWGSGDVFIASVSYPVS
jgi:hypothetical protein